MKKKNCFEHEHVPWNLNKSKRKIKLLKKKKNVFYLD